MSQSLGSKNIYFETWQLNMNQSSQLWIREQHHLANSILYEDCEAIIKKYIC